MIFLRENEHFYNIGKELAQDHLFSNVLFKTKQSLYFSHYCLIFLHIPELSSMLCTQDTHEKTVIYLPDVEDEVMENALVHFYFGNITRLKFILGFVSENTTDEVKFEPKMELG